MRAGVLAAGLIAFALAACASPSPTPSPPGTAAPTPTPTAPEQAPVVDVEVGAQGAVLAPTTSKRATMPFG